MKQLVILVGCLGLSLTALADEITKITGFAPAYVGKQIDIFEVVDYLSMKQERIASTTVQADSTFSCSFYLNETRKLVIASNNNSGFIYAQPGAIYDLYMPDRNEYDPYRPLGNKIELTLYGLDSTDINYKILTFNRWTDEILATYYTKNNAESVYFCQRIDKFKTDVENYYKNDTTDLFFRTHIKFTMGRIDNMTFLGNRNKYEKYDFYLRSTPVYYQSDTYMDYVKLYYEKLLTSIDPAINNKFYLALLKSSPSLIMHSLGAEYTLKSNVRLRELVMIKTLSEAFYEKDFPQTNILTVLDSISSHGLFKENRVIAANIITRLMELTPGSKAPDFTVTGSGTVYDLKKYSGKHLYVFFVSPSNVECQKQMELLVPIYQRYQKEVQFLMVVKDDGKTDAAALEKFRTGLPWESVVVAPDNTILKTYQVINIPYYVVIDPIGYVVAAPAMGPTPNGQYETIDKLFFYIKKAIEEGTGDGR
ncbi:MAG TPA: TlpA disulfide reductase family protein [Fluviicola sp.]|nr:TlpA disulfide reductase family protein [Fluviicola sp.]